MGSMHAPAIAIATRIVEPSVMVKGKLSSEALTVRGLFCKADRKLEKK